MNRLLILCMMMAIAQSTTAADDKPAEGSTGAKIADFGKKAAKSGDKAVANTAKALKWVGKKAGQGLDAAGNATSKALKSATSK